MKANELKRVLCAECGRPVSYRYYTATREFKPLRCKDHPTAKRITDKFARQQFSKIKRLIRPTPSIAASRALEGYVSQGGAI